MRLPDTGFLRTAIEHHLPHRRKHSATRFVNINCPVCIHRGHRADRRMRGGVRFEATSIGVNCFNCGFTAKYTVGGKISANMKMFLNALGLGDDEVRQLSYAAFQLRHATQTAVAPETFWEPAFAPQDLPDGARPLPEWAENGETDPDFLSVAEYAMSRGDDAWNATTYYWTPRDTMRRRLIVPCLWRDTIVGYAARAVHPNMQPRYLHRMPSNYLFNNHVLSLQRRYLLIVEGIFDALAIDGVAAHGAKLNDKQISWINSCGKSVIVVPDSDKAGRAMVDIALRQGWAVSFLRGKKQYWHAEIKDAADAVCRYGRLYALRTILASAETDPKQINILRSKTYGRLSQAQ